MTGIFIFNPFRPKKYFFAISLLFLINELIYFNLRLSIAACTSLKREFVP